MSLRKSFKEEEEMNGKTLTVHVLGIMLMFTAMALVTMRAMSEVEQAVFSETEVVIMFGIFCIALGVELKSHVTQYWYYKYNKEN